VKCQAAPLCGGAGGSPFAALWPAPLPFFDGRASVALSASNASSGALRRRNERSADISRTGRIVCPYFLHRDGFN
jgi:hypothetical protein